MTRTELGEHGVYECEILHGKETIGIVIYDTSNGIHREHNIVLYPDEFKDLCNVLNDELLVINKTPKHREITKEQVPLV
jgi:hypothetical protein